MIFERGGYCLIPQWAHCHSARCKVALQLVQLSMNCCTAAKMTVLVLIFSVACRSMSLVCRQMLLYDWSMVTWKMTCPYPSLCSQLSSSTLFGKKDKPGDPSDPTKLEQSWNSPSTCSGPPGSARLHLHSPI